MKAKRRITKDLIKNNTSYMVQVQKFLSECKEVENSSSRYGNFLNQKHTELFKTSAKGMLESIKNKIAYHLQYVAMKSAGVEITENFNKRYLASQKLEPVGEFTPKKEDVDMSKVKIKKSVEKDKGKKIGKERPGAVFVDLFSRNSKEKLSDKSIASLIKQRTQKEYTEGQVRGYRAGYNRGVLTGQVNPPAAKSICYDKK